MTSWDQIRNGIFAGESGGDYNALFGYSNRDKYSSTPLTAMTVDQALQFADPSGEYGQWVKGQIGRVATPMGAYQVVGTTLRAAKDALGLTGNEVMTPELQDRIGQWIYQTQGTGAWEGYRGPQDAQPNAIAAAPQAQPQNALAEPQKPQEWQYQANMLDPAMFRSRRMDMQPVDFSQFRVG